MIKILIGDQESINGETHPYAHLPIKKKKKGRKMKNEKRTLRRLMTQNFISSKEKN